MSKEEAILMCNDYKTQGDRYLSKLFPRKDNKLSHMFDYIIRQAGQLMAVAVITGASVGIGLETAIGLAQKGYDLILVSRNLNKLTRVKENIEIQFNVNCKIYSFDLSLIKENITFKQVFKDYNTVDVLINNVGAIYMSRVVTEEGLEKTFALNHMSYFVLSKTFIRKFETTKNN